MGIGWPQLLIIALVILVLFGRGRIAEMMGDFGKGIKSFKQGMNEDEKPSSGAAPQIEGQAKDARSTEDQHTDPEPAPRSDTPDMRG